jgi:hypothetical protein
VKRLMTSRMGKKKVAKGKGKGKDSKAGAPSDDSWKKINCIEAVLQALVGEGLLQARDIVQWRPAERDVRPFEHAEVTD